MYKRQPLRGGRGDFTEIKFDQIRSRCDEFGDFFAKILRFEGFPRFSLSCRRQFFFEFFFEFFLNLYIFFFEFLNFFFEKFKKCMHER